jgi:hypothetical protein
MPMAGGRGEGSSVYTGRSGIPCTTNDDDNSQASFGRYSCSKVLNATGREQVLGEARPGQLR